jgi:Leucine-rich repeat (LRR) protein
VKSTFIFVLLILASGLLHAQENVLVIEDSTFIFHSLSEALVNPDKVFRLNLSKSKLDTFPPQIFLFKNLTELDLSKNKIEVMPEAIGNLVHLRKLNLANNKLVHLPVEIGQLKDLIYLELNRNILEDLPASIGGLQNLEVLELWDNELNDLPDEISDLQNLKSIELRGILFTEEQQHRIDSLIVKTAKIYMSPSCICKN